jgi:hypothetical protein
MSMLRGMWGLLLLGSVAVAQNIVQNPGFESGSFSPWVVNGSRWEVSTVSAHTGTFGADTGCFGSACISPDSNPAGAWFYQDLPTTPGARYTLTFYYFPGIADLPGDNIAELQVLWGPSAIPLTTGGAGSCTGNCVFDNASIGSTTFVQYTVTNLLATSALTRLEFLGRQDPENDGLDDVVVQLTPSPTATAAPALTTWGLALLALALMVFGGRRLAAVGGTK